MLRIVSHCRPLLGQSALQVAATSFSKSRPLSLLCHAQCVVAPQTSQPHASTRQLSSTSAAVQENTFLPPNLSFDRRSSFAPKDHPVLVPPRMDEDEEGIDMKSLTEGDADDDEEDFDNEYDLTDRNVDSRHVVPLPERLNATIYHGTDGSVSGTIWLEESIFGVDPIRIDLIKQSVDYIRNKIRGKRKAKSKTISEVSGSGRKVRQQKGTGKARAGHSRPAHWRGGAKAHGPKNTTDYGNVKMNKKTKRLAMASTLSQKLKEGNLILVDNLMLESHKTGPWASILQSAYGIGREGASALIVDHYYEPEGESGNGSDRSHASYNGVPINLWVASGNNRKVKVVNHRFMNVYDILKKEKLVVTLSALEEMETRWKL